jgi:hypothetical protein
MKNMTVKIVGVSLALSFFGTTGTGFAEKVRVASWYRDGNTHTVEYVEKATNQGRSSQARSNGRGNKFGHYKHGKWNKKTHTEVKLIKNGQGHGSHCTSHPYATENDRACTTTSYWYSPTDKKCTKARHKYFKELKKSNRRAEKQRQREARLAAAREAERQRRAEERRREAVRLAAEQRREAARLAALRKAAEQRKLAELRRRRVKCLCHGTHVCSAHRHVTVTRPAPRRTCDVIVKPVPVSTPAYHRTYTRPATVDSQGKVRTRNALLIAAAANEIFNKSTKSKGDIRRGTLAGVLVNEIFHK